MQRGQEPGKTKTMLKWTPPRFATVLAIVCGGPVILGWFGCHGANAGRAQDQQTHRENEPRQPSALAQEPAQGQAPERTDNSGNANAADAPEVEPTPQRPGIVVSRVQAPRPSTTGFGDATITLVRVDPSRFRFRFLSEGFDGPRRPLPEWVRDFGLSGGTNAGMFLPNGRSVGFMVADEVIRSNRHPSRFEGFLAFAPQRDTDPVFAIGGRGCPTGLPDLRARYRSVLQLRRLLLDCEGAALPWENRRRYSVAAIGVDSGGWIVLIHARTAYRMSVFSQMLASMDLGLRGVAYLEGGPEASLWVEHNGTQVRETGSFEDGFNPNDNNRAFWDLPNVIGFAPRQASALE